MQYLPTRIHGPIDYLLAAILILAMGPLGYNGGGAQTWAPLTAALIIVASALLTDYEWGVAKRLPVPIHTALDLVLGLALVLSPWLLGFGHEVWFPHVAAGTLLVGLALTTQPRAYGLEHPAFLNVHGQTTS